jgi:NADH:ubiquinone oxidoreductase subunit D
MDGERILEAEPTIGYIHRAFEKIAENVRFTKLHRLQIVWTMFVAYKYGMVDDIRKTT